MINTKKELDFYIRADRIMNGFPAEPSLAQRLVNHLMVGGVIVKYLECFRKTSFYRRQFKSVVSFNGLKFIYFRKRCVALGRQLGISIAHDAEIGYGLVIPHYGCIVIGGANVIGNYAVIFQDTTIAGNQNIIGDGLYLSAGAKIVKQVTLGNNVSISANSVVLLNCGDNILLAGMPAKEVKQNYPCWYERDNLQHRVFEVEKLRIKMNL